MKTTFPLLFIGAFACAPHSNDSVRTPTAIADFDDAPETMDDAPETTNDPDTSVDPETPDPPDADVQLSEFLQDEADVVDALERLAALDLLVVSDLVVDAPAHSGNCYSLPCVDDPIDQRWVQEHAQQTDRLLAFVEAAEAIDANPGTPVNGLDFSGSAAVQTLNALEIIEIEAVQWETGGACYVSMCPEDDVRREQLQRLVATTELL